MQTGDHPPSTGTTMLTMPSTSSAAAGPGKRKNPADSCGPSAGPKPSSEKADLKRGSWTSEEDDLLVQCVKRDGEGRWSTVPKRAGLQRCGKSCRLRWMNYLRPSIRRGRFSPDEEDLILRLHRFLGNRWSLIAGRIPGRTDNEIKNYWNTHLSKKLIGLGIDPRTHKPLIAYTNTDIINKSEVPHSSSSKSSGGSFHTTPQSALGAALSDRQCQQVVALPMAAPPPDPNLNHNRGNDLRDEAPAFPSDSSSNAAIDAPPFDITDMIADSDNTCDDEIQLQSSFGQDNRNLYGNNNDQSINFEFPYTEDDLSSLLYFSHDEGDAVLLQQELVQQTQPSTDDSNNYGSGCSDEFPIYSRAAALMPSVDYGHGSSWGLPNGPEGTSNEGTEYLQLADMDITAEIQK